MKTLLLAGMVLGLVCCSASGQEKLTWAEFEKLHAELNPQDEVWKSIPWHADLLSAQRQAAEEKKLIFIWAMDGHPLGCT